MNPIIQQINRGNGMQDVIRMASGNPEALFNNMIRSNPQFAEFVHKNQGKTVEQIAKEYHVDLSVLNNLARLK